MERSKIEKSLKMKFDEALQPGEKRKIIFWYDPEGQFKDLIDDIKLDQVKIHFLTGDNYFYTKFLLEEEDPESSYLIYAALNPLLDENNWLIDTELYSYKFSADRLLIHMEEMGLDYKLRPVAKKYERFFNSNERRRKVTGYGIKDYDENKLELALMSALCGAKFADELEVFKKILGNSLEDEQNQYLQEINRFLNEDIFWKHAERYFGYVHPQRSLIKLAASILITSLSRNLDEHYLNPLKEYLQSAGNANCIYFVDNWMNHKTDFKAFDKFSRTVEKYLEIKERLAELPIDEMSRCDTFDAFDRQIIVYIKNAIEQNQENYELWMQLIDNRRTKHWFEKYKTIYEALYYAIEILRFKKSNPNIPMLDEKELWSRYVNKYYKVDNYYRHFYWNYDQNQVEILKPIKLAVENIYSNWFLDGLGTAWSAAIEKSTKKWRLEGVTDQQDFYEKELTADMGDRDKCFVIISDALRYEVAVDIVNLLNTEINGLTSLTAMLGVLPSTTKYGMAALLPHSEISINDKEHVLADSLKTDSLHDREIVLKKKENQAVVSELRTIFDMTKEERRELVKGKKIIYIYHDSIDATGHKAATEVKVFDAVQQAIEEIYRLMRIIRDDIGGVNIYITSDHGFLYKRDPLAEYDKIQKEALGAVEEKRRYMLGYKEIDREELLAFKPDYLKADQGGPIVYVPRAAIRFKVQGPGANYVHGGAALQEVVVPLIKFKALRGSNVKKKEARKVKLELVNESRKITNSLFNLELYQTEKVDDKYIARTMEVFLQDETGNILTNREIVIADKNSGKPADRTFKVRLILKTGNYDKSKDYYLIMKDTDTEIIEEKIPFKINLAISSDFDF